MGFVVLLWIPLIKRQFSLAPYFLLLFPIVQGCLGLSTVLLSLDEVAAPVDMIISNSSQRIWLLL
jgi:heme A synthase